MSKADLRDSSKRDGRSFNEGLWVGFVWVILALTGKAKRSQSPDMHGGAKEEKLNLRERPSR